MKKLLLTLPLLMLLLAEKALAHCPLCTIGAGAAAAGAVWLGVDIVIVGIFIGAASLAMGLWVSRIIKRKYIPHQKLVLAIVSFVSIVIPLLPIMKDYSSIYISFAGDYGSILNRTYLINVFLLGSIIGAIILAVAPFLSKKITKARGKTLPFQGISLTFLLLIIASVIAGLLR